MDIVMFLLQFLMYNFYSIYHSKVNAIDAKKSKIALQLSMNMQNQMVLKSTESKYILKQREIIKKNEREAMQSLAVAKIGLQNDIYSLAYAAFLDPEQLEVKDGNLPKIQMNDEEVMNIFLGAIMIIGCQLLEMIFQNLMIYVKVCMKYKVTDKFGDLNSWLKDTFGNLITD